jgi:hypothetical protein
MVSVDGNTSICKGLSDISSSLQAHTKQQRHQKLLTFMAWAQLKHPFNG